MKRAIKLILTFASGGLVVILSLLWCAIFLTPPANSGFSRNYNLSPEEVAYLNGLRQKYSGTQRTLSAEELKSVIARACAFISSRKGLENTYDTPEVRELLFGTACVETGLRPRYQDSAGNAIGLFQIEYATFCDIWKRAIKRNHPELGRELIRHFAKCVPNDITFEDLQLSDELSAIFARLKYAHIKEPIPSDLQEQALYYKKYYNTHLGRATPESYVRAYKKFAPKAKNKK